MYILEGISFQDHHVIQVLFLALQCSSFSQPPTLFASSNKKMRVSLTAVYYWGFERFFLLSIVHKFFVMHVVNNVPLHCRVADKSVRKKILLNVQDSSLHTQPHRIIDWYRAIRQTSHCSHIFLRSKNSWTECELARKARNRLSRWLNASFLICLEKIESLWTV